MWFSLGRSSVDGLANSRLAGEARMAADVFSRDFSGCLPGATTGGKPLGRLMGRLLVGGSELRLCYEGTPENGSADWTTPDRIVVYGLDSGQLTRSDLEAGTCFVVADHVEDFQLTELGTGVQIDLTLRQRDLQRTYTFVVQDP
jgi:hypothetical protein